jgi:hypothetical protein
LITAWGVRGRREIGWGARWMHLVLMSMPVLLVEIPFYRLDPRNIIFLKVVFDLSLIVQLVSAIIVLGNGSHVQIYGS